MAGLAGGGGLPMSDCRTSRTATTAEQHANDREVCITPLAVNARPGDPLVGGVALQSAVADLVEPRERDCHREAEHGRHDE